MTTQYKIYPYRWVVLAVFMLVNVTIQILWISYAPITGPAAAFLWCDRFANWLAVHVVHDRIHSIVHSRFVGH